MLTVHRVMEQKVLRLSGNTGLIQNSLREPSLCSGRGRINTARVEADKESRQTSVLKEIEKRRDVDPEAVQDKGRPVCLPVDIFHRLSVS